MVTSHVYVKTKKNLLVSKITLKVALEALASVKKAMKEDFVNSQFAQEEDTKILKHKNVYATQATLVNIVNTPPVEVEEKRVKMENVNVKMVGQVVIV